MVLVILFLETFCFTFLSIVNLLAVTADRLSRVLKTSGATQAVVRDISKAFYRGWHAGLFNKFKSYGVLKRCFILWSHFVVVKDFELFWSKSHLLSVPLYWNTSEFPFRYSLNEQKKLKNRLCESFIHRLRNIRATF